jgi:hypothetical protein
MANDKAAAAQQSLATRAALALKKEQRGEKLNRQERADVDRYRRERDEQARHQHYATVPKKDFCALAARQHKVVDDAHRNYGAPVDGKEIDLFRFVKWVFDFLAQNGRKLLKAEDGDDLLSGPETPELEKLRKVNRLIKEVEYGKLKTQVLDRTKVHEGLTRVAAIIRDCGDALQRRFGPDALDLLHQHLDAVDAEIAALCRTENGEESAENP